MVRFDIFFPYMLRKHKVSLLKIEADCILLIRAKRIKKKFKLRN